MNNPLLTSFSTPFEAIPFDDIKNEHFLPALKEAIAQTKNEIKEITTNKEQATFENTIEALEYAGELVGLISGIAFNLNSSETSDELQAITKEMAPILSEHHNDILLNESLFERIESVYISKPSLAGEQSRLLEKTYKSFVRNGAKLGATQKERLREIDKQLSQLGLEFGEHTLNEMNSYELRLKDDAALKEMPSNILEGAKELAKEKEYEGYIFTLHYPSYVPFMTYCTDSDLRKELFLASGSKAFKGDENDNQEIIKTLVNLRLERANLLGYDTHAHYVLENRMAQSAEKVNHFLQDILTKAKPFGIKELEELTSFAQEQEDVKELNAWDMSYYSEKLKKQKFDVNDELLKPYFQLEKVIDGVFTTASKLFGITFKERNDIPVYHKDVIVYEVSDENENLVGLFYADFFPRKGKRSGAWMTSFRGQSNTQGQNKRPHVSIVCNFTKPTSSQPSLLTFNEVTTLFHEFGHALHGLLADTQYESLSGTNVYWDFVELPSQVMENWCYEKECLDLFAAHYQTGEKIPEELIQKIKESASFMEGVATCRQLSFGMLDMGWHSLTTPFEGDVSTFEHEAMSPALLYQRPQGVNMSCAFSHIFAGGYSSGYYSYKWAEVLDADAFELFLEKGIFDPQVAQSFKEHVLSKGGTENPMELYKRFRGAEPKVEALLKRAGLV